MRILHVDDNEGNRYMILNMFQDHEVISCEDMDTAKFEYLQREYDLVICDGSVNTDGDGQDWAAELHSLKQAVVVFSGGTQVYRDVPFIHKLDFPLRAGSFLRFVKSVSG